MLEKISIVLPTTGNHAWDISEGWVKAFDDLGLLDRAFRPKARWGSETLDQDDGLLDYLASDPDEYLLLLGLDWHSQPLHYGIAGELLRKRRERNISLIWEDYACEFPGSEGLKSEMLKAWDRSASIPFLTFTHHHQNILQLAGRLRGGMIEYLPFGVDHNRYQEAEVPFERKKRGIYFSGKVAEWADQKDGGPYGRRRRLIEELQAADNRIEVQTGRLSESEYVGKLSASQICINLPSLSISPTLRNYEALMAGAALITWRPSPECPNDLEGYPNIFWYEWDDPKTAVAQAKQVLSLPTEDLRKWSTEGMVIARKEGSLARRAEQIMESLRKHGELAKARNWGASVPMDAPVVVDGVFFQIARNGIAYVWDSIIRELIGQIGKDRVTLINRANSLFGDYGCRQIETDAFDWTRNPVDARREVSRLLEEHGIGTDCVFASTYYTTANCSRNVQIVHDMIPEIMQGDEPVWTHKDYSINHSETLICVSGSTYWDLIACHPAKWPRARIALNGMPTAHIEASKKIVRSKLSSNPAFARATDPDAFKVLYVGGRVGWKGYKNGIVLARAFKLLRSALGEDCQARLIFVSGNTNPEDQIRHELEGLDTVFLSASDEELSVIRDHANCVVYPSFLEGFGLPVIEAVYAGVPVIASRVSPIVEAAEGHGVLHFDPSSPEELCGHLKDVYRDWCSHDRSGEFDARVRKREQVEQMSRQRWKRFVDLILEEEEVTREALPYSHNLSAFLESARMSFRVKQKRCLSEIPAVWAEQARAL